MVCSNGIMIESAIKKYQDFIQEEKKKLRPYRLADLNLAHTIKQFYLDSGINPLSSAVTAIDLDCLKARISLLLFNSLG